MFYICAKFWETFSNGIKVMERTRIMNHGRSDGHTDTQNVGGYNIIPRHFFVRKTGTYSIIIFLTLHSLVFDTVTRRKKMHLWNTNSVDTDQMWVSAVLFRLICSSIF